jgi:hypothetical protein
MTTPSLKLRSGGSNLKRSRADATTTTGFKISDTGVNGGPAGPAPEQITSTKLTNNRQPVVRGDGGNIRIVLKKGRLIG